MSARRPILPRSTPAALSQARPLDDLARPRVLNPRALLERIYAAQEERERAGLKVQRLRARLSKLQREHRATWDSTRRALLTREIEKLSAEIAELTQPERGVA
jgi:hypothetical protein